MASTRIWLLGLLALICAGAAMAGPEDIGPAYDLVIVQAGPVLRLDTASSVRVELEVHNRGHEPWSTELGFALAYHWLTVNGEVVVWDGERSPFTETLSPGESRVIDAILRAPDRAGEYFLQLV